MFEEFTSEASQIREILTNGTTEEIKKLLALENDRKIPEKIRVLIAVTRKRIEEPLTAVDRGRWVPPKPTLDQLDKLQK